LFGASVNQGLDANAFNLVDGTSQRRRSALANGGECPLPPAVDVAKGSGQFQFLRRRRAAPCRLPWTLDRVNARTAQGHSRRAVNNCPPGVNDIVIRSSPIFPPIVFAATL